MLILMKRGDGGFYREGWGIADYRGFFAKRCINVN
jgi:hypothetical protein